RGQLSSVPSRGYFFVGEWPRSMYVEYEKPARRCEGSCLWDFYAISALFPKDAFDEWQKSAMPTSSRMLNQRQNYNGSGPCIAGPGVLAGTPMTGGTGSRAPRHARDVDEAVARWFGKGFSWLPDKGLEGHGHQMMIEYGNLQIADVL